MHATSLTAAAFAVLALATTSPAAPVTIDLNGPWQVAESGSQDAFPATVPGTIHTDLLNAGKIPDPFLGENERKLQWIGTKNWTYQRTFNVDAEFLKLPHILLRCEGLDTLATIELNGTRAGFANNSFRTWEFKVAHLLKPGPNHLAIHFQSVLPEMEALEKNRPLPTWNHPGASYVRKTPCNFGWDWGPTLITCGIQGPISLTGFHTARWDDLLILQDHSQPGRVRLEVKATIDPPDQTTPLPVEFTVTSPAGDTVATARTRLATGQARAVLDIPQPQLWWPAGMGAQPLYTISARLFNVGGGPLDATSRRIGLRTLRAIPQSGDDTMHFTANGIPFFAKGANCIPLDMFPPRVPKERLRRFVEDAAAVHMNSLRFWGGGHYEDDALFDACDELGICVWMDFKFSCATYPAFDPAFLENVRQEARDQVRRLRHHPSIALWCGNNEIQFFRGGDDWDKEKMSAPDYYKLFRDTLGEVVRAHAPQADYVTGSPDCGDVHYWGVWHGGKPFEAYGEIHGFLSEFGFQSWPAPATVTAFTAPADRESLFSPVMRLHMRSGRGWLGAEEDGTTGTQRILDMLRLYFREPCSFENTLWLSQINQAFGIEYAAQLWRREMPRSMGCVYWQYNDIWPGASWSSVDSSGRWKALHYRARHFYAPVLVSGTTDPTHGTATLWTTSDAPEATEATLHWTLTDVLGTPLASNALPVSVPARSSQAVATIDLAALPGVPSSLAQTLLWLRLAGKDATLSENLLTFTKPKDLNLAPPQIRATITPTDLPTCFAVTLHATHPALWTWLDLADANATFSDNFCHLPPGQPLTLTVTTQTPLSPGEFARKLSVRSLFDTYRSNPDKP